MPKMNKGIVNDREPCTAPAGQEVMRERFHGGFIYWIPVPVTDAVKDIPPETLTPNYTLRRDRRVTPMQGNPAEVLRDNGDGTFNVIAYVPYLSMNGNI